MAAKVTLTEERFGVIKKIRWAWEAHTDGVVATTTPGAITAFPYNGEIVRLVTIPDTTKTPTNKYDVYVYDGDDLDVLLGKGEDRSDTASEQVHSSDLGIVANDHLTLKVENAGNGGKGVTILYVR